MNELLVRCNFGYLEMVIIIIIIIIVVVVVVGCRKSEEKEITY
jgi:competence protein ComGC